MRLRKLTSLTGSGDLPDTMSLLGRCLHGELAPMPRVRQAAAQCVQNLLWNAPPPEGSGEGGRSVRALGDGLAGLANQVLEGGGELATVERATLAMNLVQSLGLLGDKRFAELAGRLMRGRRLHRSAADSPARRRPWHAGGPPGPRCSFARPSPRSCPSSRVDEPPMSANRTGPAVAPGTESEETPNDRESTHVFPGA